MPLPRCAESFHTDAASLSPTMVEQRMFRAAETEEKPLSAHRLCESATMDYI